MINCHHGIDTLYLGSNDVLGPVIVEKQSFILLFDFMFFIFWYKHSHLDIWHVYRHKVDDFIEQIILFFRLHIRNAAFGIWQGDLLCVHE